MIKAWKLNELKERKVWIPYMCDAAFVLAAALKGAGYNAAVLPRSQDAGLSLGRKYTDGDQCLPSIITTEDILKRVFSSGFNPAKEAFFQGKSEGPCRFGRYYMNQLLILEKLDLGNVPIFTPADRDFYGALERDFKLLAWNGMVGQGMLERALHFTRPLEIEEGEAEKVYKRSLEQFCEEVEKSMRENGKMKFSDLAFGRYNKGIIESLKKSYQEFLKIKKTGEDRPIIFVTGEIFVRTSSVAHQDLIEKIENKGGIALLEPATSFFSYILASKLERRKHNVRKVNLKDALTLQLELIFAEKDRKKIEKVFDLPHDPKAKEIVKRGSKYIHPSYEGEAILTLGGSDYFASKGIVDGIINVMPHNCMPGMISKDKSKEINEKYDIPFSNLIYDGHVDANREEQLDVFMYQVLERKKENLKRRESESWGASGCSKNRNKARIEVPPPRFELGSQPRKG